MRNNFIANCFRLQRIVVENLEIVLRWMIQIFISLRVIGVDWV